jgi:hypothetical protein
MRQRLWERLRKMAGSTRFDGVPCDVRTVRAAAATAREKLQKKIDEVNRLEWDLLEQTERVERDRRAGGAK